MAIQLPSGGIKSAGEFVVDTTIETLSALGADEQRFERAGTRWGFNVMVAAKTAEQAIPWKVLHRRGETFLMSVPQYGLDVGSPGTPLVYGAGQTGSTINLKGFVPGYTVRAFQWLSLVTGGQRYLYQARSEVTADSGGLASVPLSSILRMSPQADDVVEIEDPKIEGWVDYPSAGFSLDTATIMTGLSFSIREAA